MIIKIPARDLKLAASCGVPASIIDLISQLPDPLPSFTNPKGLEYPVETRTMAVNLRSLGFPLRKVAKIVGMASENNVRTACKAFKNGTLFTRNRKSPFDGFVDSVPEDNAEFLDHADTNIKDLEERYQALTPDMQMMVQYAYNMGYSDAAEGHGPNEMLKL
jgi:hypothetical protein